jgi:hypothetical protein
MQGWQAPCSKRRNNLTITTGLKTMLNQRQLYFASKLYMAASKQKLSFDLPKFTANPAFAAEVMDHLQRSTQDSALLDLIGQTRECLGASASSASTALPTAARIASPTASPTATTPIYEATQPLKVVSDAPATADAPNSSANADADDENAPNRYVGRLR